MQKPLFVIEDSQITPQAAKEFLEQTNSQGDRIELNQVMREEAVDALDIRIMTDDTIKHLSAAQLANWKELPILTIAELVVRYFGMRPETGETLTQTFEKVAFSSVTTIPIWKFRQCVSTPPWLARLRWNTPR